MKERSGIPCSHLIALRRMLKEGYLDLFHTRWLINEVAEPNEDSEVEEEEIEEGADLEDGDHEDRPNIVGRVGRPKISRKRRH